MLKFIYGAMGSSKTAQALIQKYNCEQKGFNVILLKPSFDNRSHKVTSRIGLESKCINFTPDQNILELNLPWDDHILNKNILIVDEAQFCTKLQIEQLYKISSYMNVYCYGLKTNFNSELFEGSKRLLEIADEFQMLSCICSCGKNATLNILFDKHNKPFKDPTAQCGKYSNYKALCYECWDKLKKEQKDEE